MWESPRAGEDVMGNTEPVCPICNSPPPCEHMQLREGVVIHYKIPTKVFNSELQLVSYIGEVMFHLKDCGLPMGSRLYETLQAFLAKEDLPYDLEFRKKP